MPPKTAQFLGTPTSKGTGRPKKLSETAEILKDSQNQNIKKSKTETEFKLQDKSLNENNRLSTSQTDLKTVTETIKTDGKLIKKKQKIEDGKVKEQVEETVETDENGNPIGPHKKVVKKTKKTKDGGEEEVTITTTTTHHQRRRKTQNKKDNNGGDANNKENNNTSDDQQRKRRRRRRRGAKIVKKVVIRKHRKHHHHSEPEPEEEPVIIKKIRRRAKKRPSKQVVKKVIVRKHRHQSPEHDEKTLTKDPETLLPGSHLYKSRRQRNPKKKIIQYVTVIRTRVNPETGEKEQYREKVAMPVNNNNENNNNVYRPKKASGGKKKIIKIKTKVYKIISKKENPETKTEIYTEEPLKITTRLTPEKNNDAYFEREAIKRAQKQSDKQEKPKDTKTINRFVSVIRKVRNPISGDEEFKNERKIVRANVPINATEDQIRSVIDDIVYGAAKKESEEEEKKINPTNNKAKRRKIVQKFIKVIKKVKDENGNEQLQEDKQLLSLPIPYDASPEQINNILKQCAKDAACQFQEDQIAKQGGNTKNLQTKLAPEFVNNIQNFTNPETGKEEMTEEMCMFAPEVAKTASTEDESKAVDNLVNESIKNKEEKEAKEADESSNKTNKRPRKKRYHQVITVVRKVLNPETGKEELVEEKKVISAEADASKQMDEDDVNKLIENTAVKAQDKIEEEENSNNTEQNKDKKKRKKKKVRQFITVIKKEKDPETGKEIPITEKKLITAEVPEEATDEQNNKTIEDAAIEIVRKRKRHTKEKKPLMQFVTVVKLKKDPETGKDVLIEQKQLVSTDVPEEISKDGENAAIEQLATEAVEQENEKRRKRKGKKKVVHNFVTVLRKVTNPDTGKEEIKESKQLIAAEVPEETTKEGEDAALEEAATKAIEKEENNDKERQKKKKGKTKVVRTLITCIRKLTNPETGKEETKEEKQLISAEVPIDAKPEDENKAIEEIASKQLEDQEEKGKSKKRGKKRVVHTFITIQKKKVNPTTGEAETVNEKKLVALEVPEESPEAEANKKLEEFKNEQLGKDGKDKPKKKDSKEEKKEEKPKKKDSKEDKPKKKDSKEEKPKKKDSKEEAKPVVISLSDSSEEKPSPKPKPKTQQIEYYYEEDGDEEEEVVVNNITIYVDENGKVIKTDNDLEGAENKNAPEIKEGQNLDDVLNEIKDGATTQKIQTVEEDEKGTRTVTDVVQTFSKTIEIDPNEPFDPVKYGLPPNCTMQMTPDGPVIVQNVVLKEGETADPNLLKGYTLKDEHVTVHEEPI